MEVAEKAAEKAETEEGEAETEEESMRRRKL